MEGQVRSRIHQRTRGRSTTRRPFCTKRSPPHDARYVSVSGNGGVASKNAHVSIDHGRSRTDHNEEAAFRRLLQGSERRIVSMHDAQCTGRCVLAVADDNHVTARRYAAEIKGDDLPTLTHQTFPLHPASCKIKHFQLGTSPKTTR